jgi:hypothetical protein
MGILTVFLFLVLIINPSVCTYFVGKVADTVVRLVSPFERVTLLAAAIVYNPF